MRDRDQRFSSDTELKVRCGDEVFRVQLANVSSTGALVGPLRPLAQRALVTLSHLQLRIQARVVWSNGRQTGIQFVTPLSISDRKVLQDAVGPGPGVWGSSSYHGGTSKGAGLDQSSGLA